MIDRHDLAAQLLNRPLALAESDVPALIDKLSSASREPAAARAPVTSRYQPGYAVRNGVAVIPVSGVLTNRETWLGAALGFMSYEALEWTLAAAVADDAVSAILFDMNCGGGSVAGFEAGMDAVRRANKVKPITAHVNSLSASAAYGLASQCSLIVLAPGAFVGSIGVIYVHMDFSGALEKAGVRPTVLMAGDRKADETSLLPLSERARASITEEISDMHSMFCRYVGEGRGTRLTAAAARATEARVYRGEKAIAAGLADSIATFDDVLASLARASKPVPRAGKAQAEAKPTAGIRAEIAPGVVTTFASRADFDRYIRAEASKGVTLPTAERAKLAEQIRALPGAKKYPAEAARLMAEGQTTIEAARALFDGLERAGVPTSEQKTFAERSAAYASRKVTAGATVVTGGKIFRGGREAEGGVGGVIAAEHNPKLAEEMSALSGWNAARAKFGVGPIPPKEAGDAL